MKQPVIVVGMHSAGSALVSEILHHAGIFMGNDQNEQGQSKLFHRINDWIFFQAGASWDNPYNFRFAGEHFNERVAKAIKRQLKGRSLKSYLDHARHRYSKASHFDFDWGWSDPMNTFTLDIWSLLFDEPWIIHVHRNPADVAMALKNQNKHFHHEVEGGLFGRLKRRNLERKLSLEKIYELSLRVNDIEQGYELWKEYSAQALSIAGNLGLPVYHLAYENLLGNFEEETDKLFLHLGFRIPDGSLKPIKEKIRDYKPYLFQKDDELNEFYQVIKNQSLVTELNYHEIR